MTDGTGSGSPPGQAQPLAPTGSTPPAPARKTHKDKATISALCRLSLWLHLKANQTIEAANCQGFPYFYIFFYIYFAFFPFIFV